MNTKTFASARSKPNSVNEAGAPAFKLKGKENLVMLAMNGFLNGTYYNSGDALVEKLQEAIQGVDPIFAAKTAVYAKQNGAIKDAPAYILAALSKGSAMEAVKKAFPRVITNGKMLRNYVQVIRSGKVGRVSLGSSPKKLVKRWIENRSDIQLLNDSIGNDPSLKDLILLSHPKFEGSKNAVAKYILGFDTAKSRIKILSELRRARNGKNADWSLLAKLDFRHMDNIETLPVEFWNEWLQNCSYHALRMNLNMLNRKGAFNDSSIVKIVANRLVDREEIIKANQFPFQYFSAFKAADGIPVSIMKALQTAFEISMETYSVGEMPSKGSIYIDRSGSMNQPVTGYTGKKDSTVMCTQAAALFGAMMARSVENPYVGTFNSSLNEVKYQTYSNPLTFADKLHNGGATYTKLCFEHALKHNPDFVYVISDNEAWVDERYDDNSNTLIKQLIKQNPNIKIVLHNIVMGNHTVAPTNNRNVLNIAGFTPSVTEQITKFIQGENSAEKMISEIEAVVL
jgi:60 kDa SS-A/Ro ribonucleoprotein